MKLHRQRGEGDLAAFLAVMLIAAICLMFVFVSEIDRDDLRSYHNSRVATKCYGYEPSGRYVWWYC